MIRTKSGVLNKAIVILIAVLVADCNGQQRRTTASTPANASEWRERLDLTPLLADSSALEKLVIIYHPTYRQTLFVFGTGRVVLQTYPPEAFPQSASLLPTCTTHVGGAEIRNTIRTIIREHFFELPQQSFVDTGEYSSNLEFEKQTKVHDIIIDDGSSRVYRAFAEGAYRGMKGQIPAKFVEVERSLIRFAEDAAIQHPCPMAHYMEWRRAGRGESLH
jgi:hypothetical protein